MLRLVTLLRRSLLYCSEDIYLYTLNVSSYSEMHPPVKCILASGVMYSGFPAQRAAADFGLDDSTLGRFAMASRAIVRNETGMTHARA